MLTPARRIGESVILTIDGMKLIRIMLGLPVFQLPRISDFQDSTFPPSPQTA